MRRMVSTFYKRYHLERISNETRGVLVTLMCYEGVAVSMAALEHLIGPKYLTHMETLRAFNIGKFTKEGDAITFTLR